MFLYLIELFIAGVLLFKLLDDQLPSPIQVVSGILLGYLLHVLNGIVLIGVGIGLSTVSVVILVSLECVGFFLGLVLKRKTKNWFKSIFPLDFWIVGLIYVALLFVFYKLNLSFITNDSLYLILFGQDLVQSGFSEWYFASPGWTGVYIPMVQTIGMLFGQDYVWFIQPVMSIILYISLAYFGYRSVVRFITNKWAAGLLVATTLFIFISSNLPLAMLVYIHTNLSSGLFLFLGVISLYFAVEDKRDGWLILSCMSLISFSLLRIENVLVALSVVLIYFSSGKLKRNQEIKAFVPYLIVQSIWLLIVLSQNYVTYLDTLSKEQIFIILAACIGMLVLISVHRWHFIAKVVGWAGKALPILFLLGWVILGILNQTAFVTNIRSVSLNLFVTGNWSAFWWVTVGLTIISAFHSRFPQKRILLNIILIFVMIVQILGFFRSPYHERWFDSANRMMIHIAPLFLFFVVTQVAKVNGRFLDRTGKRNVSKIS